MSIIERRGLSEEVVGALARHPVCVLLGPRQCGKTTLARQLAERRGAHYFDLETGASRAALSNPELALSELRGLVVIDEIQRQPELFATLRPLSDRRGTPARFLLLGSASLELVAGVSESLAGRAHFIEMTGLSLGEVGLKNQSRLWLRGGFPRSYLAKTIDHSLEWRDDFIRTFLELDLPLLGVRVASQALRRFWMTVAHSHGQLWNGSEVARMLGVTEPVVRRYLELLTGTFMLRQLSPWHENVGKRQYKSPKIYVRDTGLLHALLGIESREDLLSRQQLGASWEGFALETVLGAARAREAYFWRTHAGAELDLLLIRGSRRQGFEFKVSDAPTMTKSLHVALSDLKLAQAWVVYPGTKRYRIHEKVEVIPLGDALAVAAA